ncbi:T6SS immunity protein Tdi1 domain-containing protein [Mesorhizobium comanense]|uniref:T6SS immunity protein Tdi1 domain-containing protein n=1 Tax=Mesorhizobium comanense TaxID=2502215 RepID=UPI0010F6EAC1|nr:T6SS immunity protein Tdi1 domain-containing protein [Mesorhizobium comanense]
MFPKFRQGFSQDASGKLDIVRIDTGVKSLNELFSSFSGASFGRGLYRIVRARDLSVWNDRITLGFPAFAGRITCFGYDWLGRTFAVDTERTEEGEPGVVMFEPGTGEALEVPANVRTFHEMELDEYRDAALASNFHATWLANGGAEPAYDQCIGYNVPLFLGGKDGEENLELTDLEVYWHISAQLIAKARGLPPGTRINVNGA